MDNHCSKKTSKGIHFFNHIRYLCLVWNLFGFVTYDLFLCIFFLLLACMKGYFGANCSRECSPNCKSDTCRHTDGWCTSCTAGWTGYYCTTGNAIEYYTNSSWRFYKLSKNKEIKNTSVWYLKSIRVLNVFMLINF